jgi:hypothetical protein
MSKAIGACELPIKCEGSSGFNKCVQVISENVTVETVEGKVVLKAGEWVRKRASSWEQTLEAYKKEVWALKLFKDKGVFALSPDEVHLDEAERCYYVRNIATLFKRPRKIFCTKRDNPDSKVPLEFIKWRDSQVKSDRKRIIASLREQRSEIQEKLGQDFIVPFDAYGLAFEAIESLMNVDIKEVLTLMLIDLDFLGEYGPFEFLPKFVKKNRRFIRLFNDVNFWIYEQEIYRNLFGPTLTFLNKRFGVGTVKEMKESETNLFASLFKLRSLLLRKRV